MAEEAMQKQYDPSQIEERIYREWEQSGAFRAKSDSSRQPYTIVIPPPNVTGVLHMGHGLNNTIQDILIRYHRLLGYNTLWLPGTDHAGIATQNVVEKKLAREGTSRNEVGREKFLENVWQWKEQHGSTIINQLKKLGAACDWERERFTMDDGLSEAVREVFVKLYEDDLIYRGEYIINWCPRCGTALADEEAEHQEQPGTLTYVRYPFVDGGGEIEIATTRPETLLGDTAVAVHPDDPRYKDKIGRKLRLPVVNREIPLIADHHVDMEFGSGAVKVTPAHDPNDFEIGNRHNLPRINILKDDATMNSNVPEKYRGMDRYQCRKALVEDLKAEGFFIKEEDHHHAVGHCYRCDTVVEPYLSAQWFVRMEPLAKPAVDAVENGEITFYTERWKKVYLNWMNNIRDWCISRQIWWGHQIPVWYAVSETGGKITRETPFFVGRSEADARAEAAGRFGMDVKLEQDPDVLDTWFSSWLWPFSTLGWPEEAADLEYFYPTSTLVTDMGIIFFWVARMIMAGYYCLGKKPFSDVYIHGTVMDDKGRKMSKSLGNGIDPLDVIKEYGADALRYTMVAITPQGQNTLLSMDKFKIGSRFANKIWNASRYILMNLGEQSLPALSEIELDTTDRWILSRLHRTAGLVKEAMAEYRFNDAATGIAHFFWDDYCDWYIEMTKLRLYGDDEQAKRGALGMLLHVLDASLRLLHPFMPFITEEIYSKLPGNSGSIMDSEYPQPSADYIDTEVESAVQLLQEVVSGVRNIRAEMRVQPELRCSVILKADSDRISAVIEEQQAIVCALARLSGISCDAAAEKPQYAAAGVGKGYEFFIPLEGVIDIAAEKERLERELENLTVQLNKVRGKLSNEKFTGKAPKEIVDKEREKEGYYVEQIGKLQENLKTIS